MSTIRKLALVGVLSALPFVACSNNNPTSSAVTIINQCSFPVDVDFTQTGLSSAVFTIQANATKTFDVSLFNAAVSFTGTRLQGSAVVRAGLLTVAPPVVEGTLLALFIGDGKDKITIKPNPKPTGTTDQLLLSYQHN